MKLRSVLFLLVLGLTAYDFTFSMPVEIVDLERMKTSIVDSSKAAEIIDNKDSDIEEDSSGKIVTRSFVSDIENYNIGIISPLYLAMVYLICDIIFTSFLN